MVTINGKTYQGNGVSVVNGVVTIDGKVVDENAKDYRVLEIKGDVGSVQTDLSVNCDNVKGNVNAGGSVICDSVGGNVDAGGSVNCNDVGGDVKAGGSVIYG